MKQHLRNALVFSVVIVAANAVGYLLYRSRDPAQPKEVEAPPAETDTIKSVAEEQKRRGVAALKTSSYSQAIVSFEAAAKLDPSDPDLPTLLEVARKLEAGQKEPSRQEAKVAEQLVEQPPPVEPPPPPAPSRERRQSRTSRRERAPEPEVEKALLLVTTTPEKLLVEVNGRAADMTPARVEVEPGTVRLVIKRGSEVLLDRKVNAAPGAVVAIQEDFSPKQEEPPSAVAIAKDDKLDLLELVDRDRAAAAPKSITPPASGPPRIVVFLPGRNGGALEASLRRSMSGLEVRVISRSSDLRDAINGTDAVIAPPGVLIDHGLKPSMKGVSEAAREDFVAASLQGEVQRSRLASMTLGVVDERGRKQTAKFVSDLVGASPKLRRVRKIEDLLPLLQFKMVDAVLVRSKDFGTLESRTQQRLYTVALSAKEDPIAVAFVAGSRRQAAERAVLDLGPEAKQDLGVGKWANQ